MEHDVARLGTGPEIWDYLKLCIHRGTQEIGGTCIEIESLGQRLVLDVGLPLDVVEPDKYPLHAVPGFDAPDPSLLGVVISHPHQDHYGLAYRLPSETPFLIGKSAEAILSAAALFAPGGVKFENVVHLEDRRPITLGPFTITPYLVDHSAYDSYAVLVEAEQKRVFYSGDIRAHGRKSSLFEKLIANPPGGVDVLLMEGTCVGRNDHNCPTEDDLIPKFVEFFEKTSGMPLVWCSGQNIDRIVTVYKACRKVGRQLIVDMYTAEMLKATGNDRIPQADWDGIRVFLPSSQKRRIIKEEAFSVANHYRKHRIFPQQLAGTASESVMLFRPSMSRDLDAANCLEGACVICSVWRGYLDQDRNKPFLDWLKAHGIPLHHCHTSGHASVADLKRLREAFAEAVVVPVHLDQRERYVETFPGVEVHEDGEWWGVSGQALP